MYNSTVVYADILDNTFKAPTYVNIWAFALSLGQLGVLASDSLGSCDSCTGSTGEESVQESAF